MNVVYILLPVALLVALVYLVMFILSVRRGQYDDTTTPPVRMLFDDEHAGEGSSTKVDDENESE